MKKRYALLIIAVMLLCLVIYSRTGTGSNELDTLKVENAQLREELTLMNNRLEKLEKTGLRSWNLSAAVWDDSAGAEVSFAAEPSVYTAGQSARFVVRLNGSEIKNVLCDWDGMRYSAQVELEADDGYSYYVTVTSQDGTRESTLLSSPDYPVYDTLVYMKSSLAAYCNLYVADWELVDGNLNITSGYVQVQLPQLAAGGNEVGFESAQLIFQRNGETVETQVLDLPAGEGAGSFETALTSVGFQMPEMADDDQLDLFLLVRLTNGETISASGVSWFSLDGNMSLIVG